MKSEKCRLRFLQNHKVLASMLGISLSDLRRLVRNRDFHYSEFLLRKNGKVRLVENPNPELKRIHHLLKAVLSDIELPSYVFSGKKKTSYKDNAAEHLKNRYVCSFDIEKFFPSCSRKLIESFFYRDLGTSRDIARTLSHLLSYKDHVPTGSPISQVLAFWINYRVFDRVHKIAKSRGYTFSLYVDDMTFSSDSKKFNRGFHLFINFHLKSNRLKLKKSKVQYFSKIGPKVITGCVVDHMSQELRAPNKLKAKVFNSLGPTNESIYSLPLSQMRSAYGRINSIRYIEGAVLPNLKMQLEKGIERSRSGHS